LFALAWRIASPRRPWPFSRSLCNGWETCLRSEAYCHADHQIRDWAPSQIFDGMAQPNKGRLTYAMPSICTNREHTTHDRT